MKQWQLITPKSGEGPMGLLRRVGGLYQCPRGPNGEIRGPLVAYSGQYKPGLHYVGFDYADCAMLEEQPLALNWAAVGLAAKIESVMPLHGIHAICGAPEGGKALGSALAFHLSKRYIFPDKELIEPKSAEHPRGVSRFVFARHAIIPGESTLLVEDVFNNATNTDLLIGKIGKVAAIVCFLNRSPKHEHAYPSVHGSVPIIALAREQFPEYPQDAPEVSEAVKLGNVVWDPKKEWHRLMETMELYSNAG